MAVPPGVYAGLGVFGGVVSAIIGAQVGARLSSTSERDENERQAARLEQTTFQAQTNVRLGKIEVDIARLATGADVNRLGEKVGQVESRVAGIESLMRLVDPRLRPGGLTE